MIEHHRGLFEKFRMRRIAKSILPTGRQMAHATGLIAAGLRGHVHNEVVLAATDVTRSIRPTSAGMSS